MLYNTRKRERVVDKGFFEEFKFTISAFNRQFGCRFKEPQSHRMSVKKPSGKSLTRKSNNGFWAN